MKTFVKFSFNIIQKLRSKTTVMAPATVGGGGSHVNGRPATGIGGKAAAATVIGGPGPPSSGTANGQFSIIFGHLTLRYSTNPIF